MSLSGSVVAQVFGAVVGSRTKLEAVVFGRKAVGIGIKGVCSTVLLNRVAVVVYIRASRRVQPYHRRGNQPHGQTNAHPRRHFLAKLP
jgi:hypothetical protein